MTVQRRPSRAIALKTYTLLELARVAFRAPDYVFNPTPRMYQLVRRVHTLRDLQYTLWPYFGRLD